MSEALRNLGEGLVLRRGRAADAEALAAFNADVLRPQDATEPNATMAAWTRDLFTGRHPTFTPDQATVVEHRPSGAIVSSALLISQTWSSSSSAAAWSRPRAGGQASGSRARNGESRPRTLAGPALLTALFPKQSSDVWALV